MGVLYLVSTPIGNLEDITLRAVKVLATADLILCEDTRRTGRLLEWLLENMLPYAQFPNPSGSENPTDFSLGGMKDAELLSYTDYTRDQRMDEVLARLAKGQKVALVSNAGTPLLSDPGYKLVQKVVELSKDFDVKVESIPGANALLPALQLSGLPPDKFIFLGFLPKSSKQRKTLFKSLSHSVHQIPDRIRNGEYLPLPVKTAICYESPYRLQESLGDIEDILGNVQVAVCRELTKMHEEVFRGTAREASEYFESNGVKGEVTLVVSLE